MIKTHFLNLTRRQKQAVILISDVVSVLVSIYLAQLIDQQAFPQFSTSDAILWLLAPFIAVTLFAAFGLYHAVVRYLGARAIGSLFKARTA